MFGSWLFSKSSLKEKDIGTEIRRGCYDFRTAPNWVINDRELVLLAIQQNWENLRFVGEKFKDDEEIVKIAISQSGYAIQHCSLSMRANKEIMKLAIEKNGYMLMFASEEIKSDLEMVKLALSKDSSAAVQISKEAMKKQKFVISLLPLLKPVYIPQKFIENKKFLLKVLSLNANIYFQIPIGYPLRADKDIRYECYKFHYDFTKDIKDWQIKPEEDIIEFLYKHCEKPCNIFYFIDPSIKLDKEFILKLIRDSNSGLLIRFLQNEELKKDYDIVKEALTLTPDVITTISRDPFDFTNCKEIAYIVLKQKPNLISFFHSDIRSDIEILKYIIEIDPSCIYHIPSDIRLRPDIAIFAISCGLPYSTSTWYSVTDKDILFAFVKQTNGEVLNDSTFPQIFKNSLEFAKMVLYEVEYQGDYFDDDVRIEATCQHKKSAKK